MAKAYTTCRNCGEGAFHWADFSQKQTELMFFLPEGWENEGLPFDRSPVQVLIPSERFWDSDTPLDHAYNAKEYGWGSDHRRKGAQLVEYLEANQAREEFNRLQDEQRQLRQRLARVEYELTTWAKELPGAVIEIA